MWHSDPSCAVKGSARILKNAFPKKKALVVRLLALVVVVGTSLNPLRVIVLPSSCIGAAHAWWVDRHVPPVHLLSRALRKHVMDRRARVGDGGHRRAELLGDLSTTCCSGSGMSGSVGPWCTPWPSRPRYGVRRYCRTALQTCRALESAHGLCTIGA